MKNKNDRSVVGRVVSGGRQSFLNRWRNQAKSLLGGCMIATLALSGCGGDRSPVDTTLEVSLSTSPTPANDVHQSAQLALQGISKFQVELLDETGKALEFQEIIVTPGSQTAIASFTLKQPGAYRIRSAAFTSDDAILGTTNRAVQAQAGANQVSVDELGLSMLYYGSNTYLPQTKSPGALEQYLSYDQPGISLQAYCFFGYLQDDNQNRTAYFSLIQRLDQPLNVTADSEVRLPFIMSGTGISTPSLGGFRTGGTLGPALVGNSISLSQPWDISVTSDNNVGSLAPRNETRARLVSGVFGQKSARYNLQSHGVDTAGRLLTTDILVEDVMGFVSEGFGVNSFLPNWLLPEQQEAIHRDYGGSVEKYLAATHQPLTGQGSYYYSAPFLQVVNYTIRRDRRVARHGRPVVDGRGLSDL